MLIVAYICAFDVEAHFCPGLCDVEINFILANNACVTFQSNSKEVPFPRVKTTRSMYLLHYTR